jgi:DNA-binding NarL/FixJ family response regulator
LIVDDSRLARMSVIRALTRLRPELTYVEAGGPDEALTMARQAPVQIAIVDFNMPGRDGLVLARELQEVSPGVAIAILSANTQEEIVAAAGRLGAAFLTKPLTESALEAFLTEAATNQRK